MKDDVALLNIILHYCSRVEEGLENFSCDGEGFIKNWTLQYTCSFCILQIGEAVKSLSPELTKNYKEIRWRGISGMRDVIAQGYDEINLETLWFSVTEEIPALKVACERILKELMP